MKPIVYDYANRPRPEVSWLDQETHHALIDLERTYGDIAWLPLSLPIIQPDNTEQFVDFFHKNAIAGLRQLPSFDHPDDDPNDPYSGYNRAFFKTLEVYRNPIAEQWFGTHTLAHKTIDFQNIFPKLYQQLFDILPFKELFFIRFWSNQLVILPHRDQDWSYNVPLSLRVMIHDPNEQPTFYVSKTRGTGERHYVSLPDDTNSFAFNNGAFWHGADYLGYNKILMVVSGIPDVTKFDSMLSQSVTKYKPIRIFNTSQRYTVYNITSGSSKLQSPHSHNDIVDLYTLLLGSPEVVNVEEHLSADECRSELRVIFWNQDAYYQFAERNQEKYKDIINRLHSNFIDQTVEFHRHTSTETFQSEFYEIEYPDANELINWVLILYFSQWFIDNILPLGQVKRYIGQGNFQDIDITGCRFFKARTSNIIRTEPSKRSMQDFPELLTYDFEHALQYAIGKEKFIYNRLTTLSHKVENFAQEYLISCEHSAVLVGHNSLGHSINLHTHRLSDTKKMTMTIMVRLTYHDQDVRYTFYEPIDDLDPLLEKYYTNPKTLEKYARKHSSYDIVTHARSSVLFFNATQTPHSVTYSSDLYLYFVYDNVEFKPGAFERVQAQSTQTLFQHKTALDQLYFWNL